MVVSSLEIKSGSVLLPRKLHRRRRFPNRGAGFDRAFREASEKLLAELIEREKTLQGAKTQGVQVGDQQKWTHESLGRLTIIMAAIGTNLKSSSARGRNDDEGVSTLHA